MKSHNTTPASTSFASVFAFTPAAPSTQLFSPSLSKSTSSFLVSTPPLKPPQISTTRTSHPRLYQMVARRERIDPSDEAFVTCNACGTDVVVSAAKIISSGVLKVKCTQCDATWTARAQNAQTLVGTPLVRQSASVGQNQQMELESTDVGVKIFISGLSPRIDNSMLKDALEQFGEVRDAYVVYDRVTGRSKGFGFATMRNKSGATAAIDIITGDASSLLGRRVNIREAIE